ncbi:hypothetical protein BSR28_06150 [Boudabousia liubingyangii]|uniref:hypothetical protein n=1 Tax=Boudabousia liubingyangii TaxID=1921764 RepID=UPI00093FF92E|nr:hypothetical protein [Boudabousia liubingyangii]OKL46998.1 hypothetical protein BSR28_06150 [Boudabousia liubingyangii]
MTTATIPAPTLTTEYTPMQADSGLPEGLACLGVPEWATAWYAAEQGQAPVEVIRALEVVCEDYEPDFITLTPTRCEELGPFEIDTVELRAILIDAYRIGFAHAQAVN